MLDIFIRRGFIEINRRYAYHMGNHIERKKEGRSNSRVGSDLPQFHVYAIAAAKAEVLVVRTSIPTRMKVGIVLFL